MRTNQVAKAVVAMLGAGILGYGVVAAHGFEEGKWGRWHVAGHCVEDGLGSSGTLYRNEAVLERVALGGSGRVICPALRGFDIGYSSGKFRFFATDFMP